jgi:hypothetical protein
MGPFKVDFSSDILLTHVRKHLVFQDTNIRTCEYDSRQLKLLKTEEGDFNLPAKYSVALKDGALMQVYHQ